MRDISSVFKILYIFFFIFVAYYMRILSCIFLMYFFFFFLQPSLATPSNSDPRFGLRQHMEEKEIFSLISKAAEFEQLTNREDEMIELESMLKKQCPLGLRGGLEAPRAKANILIQAYVSRFRPETFSLVADSNYVASNAPRIARALFEIAIKRGWATLTEQTLTVCKSLEKQIWPHQHALRQFESSGLPYEVFQKLEDKNCFLNQLWDMEAAEIGALIRHPFAGKQIRDCLALFPHVELDCLVRAHAVNFLLLPGRRIFLFL